MCEVGAEVVGTARRIVHCRQLDQVAKVEAVAWASVG